MRNKIFDMEPVDIAKALVCEVYNEKLSSVDDEALMPINLNLVWFCYILGGWKVLLVPTIRQPQPYYEVTFNTNDGEAYIDTYHKVGNRKISLVKSVV